jgi:hypothetical protein
LGLLGAATLNRGEDKYLIVGFLKGTLLGGCVGLALIVAIVWTIIALSIPITLPLACTRHICSWAWPSDLFYLGGPLLILVLPTVVVAAYRLHFRTHLLPPTMEGLAVGFSMVFGGLVLLLLLSYQLIPPVSS